MLLYIWFEFAKELQFQWVKVLCASIQKEKEKSFQNGDISFAKCFATVNWFILFFLPTSALEEFQEMEL